MGKKPLIFGTGVSSLKDEEGLTSLFIKAIENGIFSFDSAPSYRTEEIMSAALKKLLIKLVSQERIFTFRPKSIQFR